MHVVRGNVVDQVVFFGTAALMVVLLVGDLPPRPVPGWLSSRWVAGAGSLAVGLVVLTQPRAGAAVRALLVLVGAVALAIVLRAGRGGPVSPARAATGRAWPWAAVLLTGCLLELADFLAQPDPQTDNPDHPTLSSVVDPLLDAHPVRAVVAAAWVVLGWLLVRIVAGRGRGS